MTKTLPGKKFHKTPRMLWSDAYTINGFTFESAEATAKSKYYATFRTFPHKHEAFYDKEDHRILFAGLQALCDILFYDPITHDEIDEAISFLKGRKVLNNGTFEDWEFPEILWRRVVDECEGYLPLKITALPEGSVVYPNEPFMRVEATKSDFGPLVPWFESTLLHVWAASERLTAARHFYERSYQLIRKYEPSTVSDEQCSLFARIMIHDFGDRAAASSMESELVAKMHNYVWFGTDSFRAAYQNWKNGAPAAFGSSVKALAHRIVQGFKTEGECYETMFKTAKANELLSMVGDCYDYWTALEKDLIPLAIKCKNMPEETRPTIVARPDSGNSLEMVLGTLKMATKYGLMEAHECADGQKRLGSTALRFIVGNGESFDSVIEIINSCLKEGFLPWRCGIFGIGGHLRNNINRDHLSTKFALCAVGEEDRPVIKLSNTPGKRTLPDCKVLRTADALSSGKTLVLPNEEGEDALVVYYDGSAPAPFGIGFTEDFLVCENRIMNEFNQRPKNGGFTSDSLATEVNALMQAYLR